MKKSKTRPSVNWRVKQFEALAHQYATPVLVLLIVACGAFLAGTYYHPQGTVSNNVVSGSATTDTSSAKASSPVTPTASVIDKPTAPTNVATSQSEPNGLINVNTASETELESLNGIGPTKAQAIISYRQQHGPFTSVDQLDNVSGIGPATLAKIRDQVTL